MKISCRICFVVLLLMLLMLVSCSQSVDSDVEEDAPILQDEEFVLEVNKQKNMDMDGNGEEDLFVLKTDDAGEFFYLWNENRQVLSEMARIVLREEFRVLRFAEQVFLVLYAENGSEEYGMMVYRVEEMGAEYLGMTQSNQDYFPMDILAIEGSQITMDTEVDTLKRILPVSFLPREDSKDESLDYLGLPIYSIQSGWGEPDAEEETQDGYLLSYEEEQVDFFAKENRIERICIHSGSVLGFNIGEDIKERPTIWEELALYERYQRILLPAGSEEIVSFDWEQYYVECFLMQEGSLTRLQKVCIWASELYEARLREEHILLDRFGDLLYINSPSSHEILLQSDVYQDMVILWYEREMGIILIKAEQEQDRMGVYRYDLENRSVKVLAESILDASYADGLLEVTLMDDRKQFFNQAGEDITQEVMAPNVEEMEPQFFVEDDTLYYTPSELRKQVILFELSSYLERPNYSRFLETFETTWDVGFLQFYYPGEGNEYWLYSFLPEERTLRFIHSGVKNHRLLSKAGEPKLMVLTEEDGQDVIYRYGVDGTNEGLGDWQGNLLETKE